MSDQTFYSLPQATDDYINRLKGKRASHTARTYRTALNYWLCFLAVAEDATEARHVLRHWPAHNIQAKDLRALVELMQDKEKGVSQATESVYLTALEDFFQFLSKKLIELYESEEDKAAPRINPDKLLDAISEQKRKKAIRLPNFPEKDIDQLLEYALQPPPLIDDEAQRLIAYRDRAFIITLADTGLRVHEACQLTRGQMNWDSHIALVIGKGDREAVVRFSKRAMRQIRAYLEARRSLDGGSGRSLATLPVFARHDPAAGSSIKAISTNTGRAIVGQMVENAGIEEGEHDKITPHSLRHYFVTKVLERSKGQVRLAQEMARHQDISTTQIYTHLQDAALDEAYDEYFNDPGKQTGN